MRASEERLLGCGHGKLPRDPKERLAIAFVAFNAVMTGTRSTNRRWLAGWLPRIEGFELIRHAS